MKRLGFIILAGLCAVSFSVAAFAQAPAPAPGSPGEDFPQAKNAARPKAAARTALIFFIIKVL